MTQNPPPAGFLVIQSPGPLTTVQDLGRSGFLASGFSPSGAMDALSARMANLLVGNPQGEAVLEMTIGGITAGFSKPCVFSLTGADMGSTLNGRPIPLSAACVAKAGDILCCGIAKIGCRGYLAISGGFLLPQLMGSASTNLKCRLGGFQGRKLEKGDWLPLRTPIAAIPGMEWRKSPPLKENPSPLLRVIPGPQHRCFTAKGIKTFYHSAYLLTPQSDRMGARLEGPPIEAKGGVDILSDGIAFGAVQVPASGKPIVLLADRQTTGGYAKIGTVATVDLPLLAQARPGSTLRFAPCTVKRAQELLRQREKQIEAFAHRLSVLE